MLSTELKQFLLKKFAIGPLFEVVVDAAQFKVLKPSPEVCDITLKRLSLEPTACWIIDDSINDLIAAKQAALPWGSQLVFRATHYATQEQTWSLRVSPSFTLTWQEPS
jgi:beta-phosphoglucomutase-like phosphatase (HAD superfamily)